MPSKQDTVIAFIHGPDVSASFERSKEQLFMYDSVTNQRIKNRITAYCSSGGLAEGRNTLAQSFLEGDCDWMLMVDADMGFEPDILDKLLSVADPDTKPIIGGLCFANRQIVTDSMGGFVTRAYPTILNWTKCDDGFHRFVGQMHYPVNSLISAGATGAAMLLIHRNVFERIRETYDDHFFTRIMGDDDVMISEDISFFDRCRDLEIPLFIHTGARTSHAKISWIAEMDFWDTELPPPATDRCAVIVPALHRPQNVAPLIDSLRASTGLAIPYFVVDEGDQVMADTVLANGGRVITKSGSFAVKANYAVKWTDEPWLLFVGDDVHFHSGWLNAALDIANRYDKSVIATNDCHNPFVTRGEHATHPLIERRYIDEFGASFDGPGTVAHEGYGHMFIDNEWTFLAKARQAFAAALGSRVEHLHPFYDETIADDEIYAKGRATVEADQQLWIDRVTSYMESAK